MRRAALWLVGATLLAFVSFAIVHLLLTVWLWHPLGYCPYPHRAAAYVQCRSYGFWSGAAGSFLTSLPGWFVALGVYLRAHNCHQPRCPRLSWHPHPEHGHPVCKHHHPHADPNHPIWSTDQ